MQGKSVTKFLPYLLRTLSNASLGKHSQAFILREMQIMNLYHWKAAFQPFAGYMLQCSRNMLANVLLQIDYELRI